jgi:hypothetical protein
MLDVELSTLKPGAWVDVEVLQSLPVCWTLNWKIAGPGLVGSRAIPPSFGNRDVDNDGLSWEF